MTIQSYDLFEVRKFQLGQTVEINELAIRNGISNRNGKGRITSFSGKDRYVIEWKENPMFATYSIYSPIWEGWLSHSEEL